MIKRCIFALAGVLSALSAPALGGPPYVSDDPEPTDYGHFEIYLFGSGTAVRDGTGGAGGIDFNYGAAPDLQLTGVVPLGFDSPSSGRTATGLGNIELAAKYKILHQDDFGWDVAVVSARLPTRRIAGGWRASRVTVVANLDRQELGRLVNLRRRRL